MNEWIIKYIQNFARESGDQIFKEYYRYTWKHYYEVIKYVNMLMIS